MTKYNAVRTEVDGITFASKKEAKRYGELKMLEKAGKISGLALQVKFPLNIGPKKICNYVCDFSYTEKGEAVIEDVKGYAGGTPVYKLKKKLMNALYGIEIREV